MLFIKQRLIISQQYQKSRSKLLRVSHKGILNERKDMAAFNESQPSGIYRLKPGTAVSLCFSGDTEF